MAHATNFSAFNPNEMLRKNLIEVDHTNVGETNFANRRFLLTEHGAKIGKSCMDFFKAYDNYYKKSGLEQQCSASLRAPHFSYRRISYVQASSLSHKIKVWRDDEQSLVLLVDEFEDRQYQNNIGKHCQLTGINCETRKLPVGDYVFVRRRNNNHVSNNGSGTTTTTTTTTTRSSQKEYVQQVIIERKTWDDLAASLMPNSRKKSRFNCAQPGKRLGSCSGNRCQICRMIASKVSRRLLLVEGPTCTCKNAKLCRTCKQLTQRHDTNINELQKVIDRIVIEYGFMVIRTEHFTGSIQWLTQLTQIVQNLGEFEKVDACLEQRLTYDELKKNIKTAPYIKRQCLPCTTYSATEYLSKWSSVDVTGGGFAKQVPEHIVIHGVQDAVKNFGKTMQEIWKSTNPPYLNDLQQRGIEQRMETMKMVPKYIFRFYNLYLQVVKGVFIREKTDANEAHAYCQMCNATSSSHHRNNNDSPAAKSMYEKQSESSVDDEELFKYDQLQTKAIQNVKLQKNVPVTGRVISLLDESQSQENSHGANDIDDQEHSIIDLLSQDQSIDEGEDNKGGKIITSVKGNSSIIELLDESQEQENATSKWVCTKCTFENTNMNTICELCNTPQSTVVHSITNDATSSSSLTSQKANNNKKRGGISSKKSSTNDWDCPMCTLSNPANLDLCQICNTKNPIKKQLDDVREMQRRRYHMANGASGRKKSMVSTPTFTPSRAPNAIQYHDNMNNNNNNNYGNHINSNDNNYNRNNINNNNNNNYRQPTAFTPSTSPYNRNQAKRSRDASRNGRHVQNAPAKKKRITKCGNCGRVGHTRANESLCPNYYDVSERRRREEKRIDKERKLKEKEVELQNQMNVDVTNQRMLAQLQMQMHQIGANNARNADRYQKELAANRKKMEKLQRERHRDL